MLSRGLAPPFWKGFSSGFVALLFLFFLRIGGYAPFPPESALEAFIRIVPAFIQEPAVQNFGDAAGMLGLVVATLVALVVYGLLGVLHEKYYAPKIERLHSITRLERFLIYALFPWLLFGAVVMPLAGFSLFGITSPGASAQDVFIYPISLLFGQGIFSIALMWEYGRSKPSLEQIPPKAENEPQASRRTFVEKGALVLGSLLLLAASLDGILTTLAGPSSMSSQQGQPVNLQNAPAIFSDPRLTTLVDSEVTANDNFYRVAIDLFDPSVKVDSWSLQVLGLVAQPKTYTMTELQFLKKQEQYTTFECVSNVINGNLISNALWGGVRISDLFADVGGVLQSAQYVVFYSVDGYSVAVPLSRTMLQDSLLAYQMNKVTLPQNHGFPLRAVIPGLYGMMSAKWIRKIEVVDAPYSGYWQTRGWTQDARIHTVSFITIPGDGSSASLSKNNGSVILGGYAFAGDRGVSKVEVSMDRGQTWQSAQLKQPLSNLTWALWAFDWHPQSTGDYEIYARVTDGAGDVQTSDQAPTFPNGATGYATMLVRVTN